MPNPSLQTPLIILTTPHNALLQRLDDAERHRLIAHCERTPLQPQTCVCASDEPVRHVYFPVEGFLVLQAQAIDTPSLEIAMVGREGMFDILTALGVPRTPVRAVVQAEGWAWRLPVDVFQRQLVASPALKRLMHRYAAVVMNQLTSLALCLRFHDVEARVAGWLLASQDRTGSTRCHITQEALSAKLGVRRVSVTTVANALQRRWRDRVSARQHPGARPRDAGTLGLQLLFRRLGQVLGHPGLIRRTWVALGECQHQDNLLWHARSIWQVNARPNTCLAS